VNMRTTRCWMGVARPVQGNGHYVPQANAREGNPPSDGLWSCRASRAGAGFFSWRRGSHNRLSRTPAWHGSGTRGERDPHESARCSPYAPHAHGDLSHRLHSTFCLIYQERSTATHRGKASPPAMAHGLTDPVWRCGVALRLWSRNDGDGHAGKQGQTPP
jgi:hypothetical protein